MTLYAKWADPCAVTASTDAPSIDIPYGQEWTDISVTLNSLTLNWFQNAGRAVREADAVAVTPYIGTGANADFTFYDGSTTLTATKGATVRHRGPDRWHHSRLAPPRPLPRGSHLLRHRLPDGQPDCSSLILWKIEVGTVYIP